MFWNLPPYEHTADALLEASLLAWRHDLKAIDH